jgi:coenzyme F420-reducing hydrogenase alpha subunit
MKLNKETLKRIIKEELQATLRESMPSGGTDYYNKLITLMSTKAGVYQAESLYEFARDQLDDEEKTFLDNCFRLLEIGREATKIGDVIDEIGKQIREIMGRNDVISAAAIYGTDKNLVEELADRRKELYQQIRELDDLFDQQLSIVGDSVGRMVKENPRVYAFYNSREAGVEEASGHFGMLSI